MEIKCFECKKGYKPNQGNTKIYGPYMKTMCPYCLYTWEGKFLNFTQEQLATYEGKSLAIVNAIRMQKFAQFVELSSSDYYKRGKRKNAKKRQEPK